MSNSFFMSFKILVLFLIVFILVISILFIPTIYSNDLNFNTTINGHSFIIDNNKYVWPTPGYTYITSYFGNRYSPTYGASSYHAGIDIGAPQGSSFIAITSGIITFTGFLGGGGYTITLTNGSMKITYCHVSPHYVVKEGDMVNKGDIIRICWT